ncbi:MAG: hypothetical protein U0441_17440 [Polyangiaceae bacterium]
MRRSLIFWFAGLVTCVGCFRASSTVGAANYRGAAVGAAFGLAAAGVNRAITGDCWAACRPGTRCDRKSGLCERIEPPEEIPAPYPTVRHQPDEPPPESPTADLDAGTAPDADREDASE